MPPPGPYRRVTTHSRAEILVAFLGVVIGILVFGGLLAVHAVYLIPVPCTSTFGCTPPTPDVAAYANTIRTLAWISVGALDIAAGLSVALAFIVALRPEIPESTRRSVFTFATVFTSVWAVGGFLILSLLGIVRYY